ncbi:MAG: acyltransferase [Burkholderiaceae bacterium]|jgi:1-acyl-sn-glycerol-3-phosphate acyltransferase|nr:acyltransferase [Gemmatimonadales bacterium]MCO5118185.1 acyltransferase [Burkholderiaceae bacterium]MEB2319443.1 acyltransferase [Pseudomonadota bacterium]
MLSFLPPTARGGIAAILLVLNILAWTLALFALALVRLVLPFQPVRRRLDPWLNRVATAWISGNSAWMRLTQRTDWDVDGIEGLDPRGWYMVSANHQTWVDIFVLQHVLNRRIPLLKFFLKHELIWVPVMGLAWWALDFPFMRRHSDAYLREHPEKRFEDLETSKRACEKFALVPTSVMNFPEGTRFTAHKHAAQRSPYAHLLRPKAGALALSLAVLGEQFRSFLDVTIVYPDGAPSFWQFLCGRVPRIIVRVRRLEVPEALRGGDPITDSRLRKAVHRWQLQLWAEKDALIAGLLDAASRGPSGPAPTATRADESLAG